MMAPKRNLLFQCFLFRFHVSVWGCKESASWLEELVEDPSESDLLVRRFFKRDPFGCAGKGSVGFIISESVISP